MTDRTDHHAAAEGELLNAIGYVHDADLSKADRAYQCVNFALIHALLAIHDTLTALKPEPVTVTHPWSNPLTVTHPWPPWPSTLPDVDAADRYAANEERQRKADEWEADTNG